MITGPSPPSRTVSVGEAPAPLLSGVVVASAFLLCGCGARPADEGGSSQLAGADVSEDAWKGDSYDHRDYPWHTYTVEHLVTPYERSDPPLEVKIAGYDWYERPPE